MKKIIQYGFKTVGFIVGVGALIFGILSYFIRSIGPNNAIYDGLGRKLEVAPFLLRFLFLNDTMWPGLLWAIFDWVFFFGLLGLAYALFNFSTKFEKKTESK